MDTPQHKAILFLTELKRKCDTEVKFSTAEICTYLKVGKQWATVAFNNGFYNIQNNRYTWICEKPISIALANEFLDYVKAYNKLHKKSNNSNAKKTTVTNQINEERLIAIEAKLDLLLRAFNITTH